MTDPSVTTNTVAIKWHIAALNCTTCITIVTNIQSKVRECIPAVNWYVRSFTYIQQTHWLRHLLLLHFNIRLCTHKRHVSLQHHITYPTITFLRSVAASSTFRVTTLVWLAAIAMTFTLLTTNDSRHCSTTTTKAKIYQVQVRCLLCEANLIR